MYRFWLWLPNIFFFTPDTWAGINLNQQIGGILCWVDIGDWSKRTWGGVVHLRRYFPVPFSASLSISAFFLLCICFAFSFISTTACVLGNPISQYPGGVAARAQACRCREIAFLCDLISCWRRRSDVVGPVWARFSFRVGDLGGFWLSGEWERDWRRHDLAGLADGERQSGGCNRLGRGPTPS